MKKNVINFLSLKSCLLLIMGTMFFGLSAQPYLLQDINISNGGTGLRMLLGDVTGDGRMEMVTMQADYMADDRYIGHEVNCLTAYNVDGTQLWQVGDPSIGAGAGSDIPAQIYDIDQDGENEVLACMNGRVRVFDGSTGTEEYSFAYPHPDAHDCIIILNLTGTAKPQDIILKDRYNQVWAMDRFGNLLWTHSGNTGHYPWPYDFDGDGKEELMCGYDFLDDDGTRLWTANEGGHADCIWVGDVDGNSGNGMEIALGGDDVAVYNWNGSLIWRNNEPIEPQNIALGNFRPDLPGIEVAGQDRRDRGDPGEEAIFLMDGNGDMVTYNTRSGWSSILYSMKNWEGNNNDYIMIWRNSYHLPSLFNGNIQQVVSFPQDGYMMSADMNGDNRDEVIIFTDTRAYIYGSNNIDITQPVSGIPAPRPQLKKYYNFTRYWGGDYIESGGSCTPTAITPYVQVNGGTWNQTSSASVSVGDQVSFGPQPISGGSWNWSGPNGFSASTREVTISNIQTNQAGNYVATYTNSCGTQSIATFNVSVSGGPTGTTMTIQENQTGFCGVDGTVDNNNSGFTGDGFANTSNATGNGVDYKVTFSSSGTYTFTFGYASTSDRPGRLIINGATVVSSISFPSTASWTTWSTVLATAGVSAGTFDVRVEATGTSGLGNIDYMQVTGTTPSAASCISTPTYTLTTNVNGQGSISPSGGTYEAGTVITLTATPASGWQFDNWSGSLSGSTNPANLTINSNVTVTANFSEVSQNPVTVTVQENQTGFCSVDGTVDNNNAGFTGDGFANTSNASGMGITWSINVPSSGSYTLVWRYVNGSTTNRTGQVMVDGGTVISNVSFPGTGAWTSWTTTSGSSVSLSAGTRLIRLQATNSSGLANIDYMSITGVGPSGVNCTGQRSAILTGNSEIRAYPNPVHGNDIHISGMMDMDSKVMVYVYNNMGQLMISHDMGMIERGSFEKVIAVDKLDSGMYHMKLIMGSDIKTIPFVKE